MAEFYELRRPSRSHSLQGVRSTPRHRIDTNLAFFFSYGFRIALRYNLFR
jgi:hypothetical protein